MPFEPAPDDLTEAGDQSPQARLRASRRQAIVKALGKGGAVIAAASPLHSYASRNIVTSTGQQCTVSGHQSAAVSASAGTQQVCGAYHPRHFIDVSKQFSLTNSTGYTSNQLAAFNALSPANVLVGTEHLLASGNAVFIKTSATAMRKVTRSGWPASVPAQTLVNTLFSGLGAKTLLAQLYDWTNGNTVGETDGAFFVAAYLNAALGTAPIGFAAAVPFDGAYVQAQYTDNYASALAFFKLVCTVDNDSKPFP